MRFKNIRWISLVAGIVVELCIGIGDAWSVFQNPLVHKFGWSTSAVTIAFTILTVMGATAPLVGKLQEYLRTRTIVLVGAVVYGGSLVATGFITSITGLYVCYGVGIGMGVSMVYPIVIAYMVKTFPEKRGLVSGLMVASYASGAVIWAPVGAYLTNVYGVLNAFKFMGIGLFLIIAVTSTFIGDLRDAPAGLQPAAALGSITDKTWREMLGTPIFYVIFFAIMIGTTSGLMILSHASPIIQSTLHISAQEAAFFVGMLAAANAFGRLFWGSMSDKVGRYPLLALLFVLCFLSFFTLSTSPAAAVFLASLVVIQSSFGGYMCLMAPITADIFGTRHLSINYGIMFIAFSCGGIVGPRVAAVVQEAHNGSYREAYLIAMFLCIVGLILAVIAMLIHSRRQAAGEKRALAV